jgi:hypothetical protein
MKNEGRKKVPDFVVDLEIDLTDIKTVKKSYQKLIELYAAGKVYEKNFTRLCWAYSGYLQVLRFEREVELDEREKRIVKIAERLGLIEKQKLLEGGH